MLHKTQGIVLSHIKYSESSIIARIYTSSFGLQSYMVNGVRSKSSKNKIALFQPLTLTDLVVYHKPHGGIQRISEIKLAYPYKAIPFDFKKITVGIFLSELLTKCLKEEEPNEDLYEFIYHSLILFDSLEEDFVHFHLQFIARLSHFLGFGTERPEDVVPFHISTEERSLLQHILTHGYDHIQSSSSTRRIVLEHLLSFYAVHIANFGTLNSMEVLREIMS